MVSVQSFEDIIKMVQEYQKQIIAGVVVIVALVFLVWGYFYYVQTREMAAHAAMVNALEYVDATITKPGEKKESDGLDFLDKKEFASEQEKWEKVAEVCASAYRAHKSAGIAPLFLAYQADALLKLGKRAEAMPLLEKTIQTLKNSDLQSFYRVKLALAHLDDSKEADVQKGIDQLKNIARYDTNVANDTALYRLGQYYWYKKNFVEARNYWNQLLLKFGSKSTYPSPWAAVAREKLELIDSDVA